MILNRLKLICVLIVTSFTIQSQNIISDNKQNFYSAKKQIEDMLSGKEPLNYEKSVFITENAFHDNRYKYEDFCFEINLYTKFIKGHYLQNKKKSEDEFKTTLIESSQSKYKKYCKNTLNYSIYSFITDTIQLIDSNKIYVHTPFKYSFNDPLATTKWDNSQVLNLLYTKRENGNCYALTALFKIFSERLNTEAYLTTAPNHIFITHKDENDIVYNVELGSRAFPGNGSIEALTYTTDKAIKSKIAMRKLDLKQSIVLNLIYLAKSYQNKFQIENDEFILGCANSALKFDSLNLNAMLLKAELLEDMLFANLKSNNISSFEKIKNNSASMEVLKKYEKQIKILYDLGYLEMPMDMKNIILSGYNNDPYISLKNNTPTSIQSKGGKHDNDYITLSKGIFDENPTAKEKEKYSRVLFDTKRKCIVGFANREQTYNGYDFDPVLFALNIDPLFKKYPSMSPYSAFANNPILFVDTDGQEFVTNIKVKDEATGKTVQYKVTFDGTNTTMTNVQTNASSNYEAGTSKFVDDMVTSYNYIVSNGADVDNAMQTLASSKDIQIKVVESSKGRAEYKDGKIVIDFNSGLEIYDDATDEFKGVQSGALGFWSEVYHGYLDKVDKKTKDTFDDDIDKEEEFVHTVKEAQVIDKLKAKDPSNNEPKRKKYSEGQWDVKTSSPTSTEKAPKKPK